MNGRFHCRTSPGGAVAALVVAAGMTVAAQGRLTWQGVVTADEDPTDRTEIQIVLSPAYRPLYEYETSTGVREVELTTVGQVLRFVPPGGGVKTVRVEELEASPARVRLALLTEFERSSQGILEQRWTKTMQTLVSEGTAFRVTIEVLSDGSIGDRDQIVTGSPERSTYRGLLRRQ